MYIKHFRATVKENICGKSTFQDKESSSDKSGINHDGILKKMLRDKFFLILILFKAQFLSGFTENIFKTNLLIIISVRDRMLKKLWGKFPLKKISKLSSVLKVSSTFNYLQTGEEIFLSLAREKRNEFSIN